MNSRDEERLATLVSTFRENDKIAIFPYGKVAREVCEVLKEKWGITPAYRVDNLNKDDGCMTLQAFAKVYQPFHTIVLFAVTDTAVFTKLFRDLFLAGIHAKDVRVFAKFRMLSADALEWVINHRGEYKTVLDVGCGDGLQGRYMTDYGFDVTGLTMSDEVNYSGACLPNVIKMNFFDYKGGPFDVVWASHILEHIPIPDDFLRHAKKVLRPGGCLAITVPNDERAILASHIHSFNAGRLLRYLLVAGFDCRNAQIYAEGYNLSIILPHVQYIDETVDITDSQTEKKVHGTGERIYDYLPSGIPIYQAWDKVNYFDGDIKEYKWEHGKEFVF